MWRCVKNDSIYVYVRLIRLRDAVIRMYKAYDEGGSREREDACHWLHAGRDTGCARAHSNAEAYGNMETIRFKVSRRANIRQDIVSSARAIVTNAGASRPIGVGASQLLCTG